ncbi:MAG TPA: S8 family serine peptidase [Micromonosporaceae bacterium]|nr:S8 family serine peptidase [Micromonosporaceae bacterium]
MTPQRWRLALVGLAVGLTVPLGTATQATAAPTAPDPASAIAGKADRKVTDEITKTGKSTFWVFLSSKADLSGANKLRKKADKAAHVYRTKTEHANRTQAGLRGLLKREGADFTPFWLVNTIRVTGDADLLAQIALRSDVSQIRADEPVPVPEPMPGKELPTVNANEWNIDRINAPRVWNDLGVRGEGIVVANIDTGVQFDHPALAQTYRGRNGDGSVDHNYSWFDPARVCPTTAPCDNNDHGTHTMGTMVGLDGTNVIGVAPGAKWIAAKGCESSSCSRASLLASGEWIVAPTDLNGANPRPDLAPDIVNNSWGGGSADDPWYHETVSAWVAAGIFPAFANGNSGPGCNTAGVPGRYAISYSSGAFDINNAIASFSSRGAGENGVIKPDIAAPGVNVRSAVRGGGYAAFNGTSMASPHTAAAVALMWSASPSLHGDIAETRRLLDQTAIDTNNTTCGGTAEKNNVFGEGRLDAYAAVEATPRGALGAVGGQVTSGGAALAGATVAAAGPMNRTVTTATDGSYALDRLMVGDYTITVSKFGYITATASVTIVEDQTATRDITIEQAPSGMLSGTVRTSAGPAAGAKVTVLNTPLAVTTNEQGRYTVTIPQGNYEVRAEHAYRCAGTVTEEVSVTGDTTLDISLPDRTDKFGYSCGAASGSFVPGVDRVNLSGDDVTAPISLPFGFPLYGKSYRTGWISTNGIMGFGSTSTSWSNTSIPSASLPNLVLYPFWDDLYVDANAGIYTTTVGSRPHRTFVVEWRNITTYSDRNVRLTFTAAISEDGSITYRYRDIDGSGVETGTSATIGLENADGTDAFQYSYNESAISDGTAIAFRSTKHGLITGVVTDANDGLPVAGATVTAQVGDQQITDTTDEDGFYGLQAPAGALALTVEKQHYEAASASFALSPGAVEARSLRLRTARVTTPLTELALIAPADQARTRQVGLSNTGGLDTDVTVKELNADGAPEDVSWLSLSDMSGLLPSGGRHSIEVTVTTAGLTPGTYHHAKLQITSNSGRQPVTTIPVTLVVPSYALAIDVGAAADHTDVEGQGWTPDRAYVSGGAGYLGTSSVRSTNSPVNGTNDPDRFGDQREGMHEYRVDGLADGYYTVELDFAELRRQDPNRRIFDVLIEGEQVLPALDVAGEVGSFTALTKTFTVRVTDGQLNVRFVTHRGFGNPILNSLRVVDRPDLAS